MFGTLKGRTLALGLSVSLAVTAGAATMAAVATGTLSGANTVDFVPFRTTAAGIGYFVSGSSSGSHALTCKLQQLTPAGVWNTLDTVVLRMPSDSNVGLVSIPDLRPDRPERLRFRLSMPLGSAATDWEVSY